MKNQHILLDLDGVLADFFTEALERLNFWLKTNVTREEYVRKKYGFVMEDAFGISKDEFWEALEEDNNFWCNLKPFPWAGRLVGRLEQYGEITIATTPSDNPECAAQKLEWLKNNLDIGPKNVMIGQKKFLMARPDTILIDDYHKNTEKFTKFGGQSVLVPSNWNYLEHNFDMVWAEIEKRLKQ